MLLLNILLEPRQLSMSKLKLLVFLHCVLGLCIGTGANDEEATTRKQPEKLLIDHLMTDYERDARPVPEDHSRVLTVNISISLKQIIHLDIKNHILSTYAWIAFEWEDIFLKWDPKQFFNLTDIRLPVERIWVPDLELYNGADAEVSLSDGHTPLIVKSDGKVSWIEPKELHSSCPVDITYFPFDQQSCTLTIGSWTHDGFMIDLQVKSEEIELQESAQFGEWNVIKTEIKRSSKFYSCCPEPYVDLAATLVLQRRSMHYVCNTIIPCLLLSILVVLTLQLTPDSSLRLGLETIILIAFSIFVWNITSILPISPNSTPLLLIYLLMMTMLTFASIVFSIAILKLHQAGAGFNTQPLPQRLRFLLCKEHQETLTSMRNDDTAETGSVACVDATFHRDDMPLTEYSFTETVILQERSPDVAPSSSSSFAHSSNNHQAIIKNAKVNATAGRGGNVTISVPPTPTARQGNYSAKKTILAEEWKFVAQTLDQIGFWGFALMTLLVNTCLVILSMQS